jgi:hypothetical protein
VKLFSQLGAPLTDLTKKGAFRWSKEAEATCHRMKKVICTILVLSLLDFSQGIVLECDASREGIGAVLMQNKYPITFERRKMRDPKRLYSIYDKEMLAIMHALAKFRKYRVGGHFVVRINHDILRYFLEQWDLSERQQKWVSKFQAYDFDNEYTKGKKNVVVDALSRRLATFSMTEVSTDWKLILLVE